MAGLQNSYKSAVLTMMRVVYALMLRETKTRYGRLQIGYLWAFLEPIMIVAVLGLIFTYMRMRHSMGLPLIQFLMTGYISFMLFRDVLLQTMLAIRPNLQLLYFPQVQLFDLGAARALLELSTFLIVFPILTLLIAFTEVEVVAAVDDPLRMLLATCMIVAFAYGVGTGLGALMPLFPSLQVLVPTTYIRPMFFLSGVFFTIEMIPENVRPYALLNPMMQLIELMRSAYFPQYESEYVDYPYLIGIILTTVLIGLLMQRALRRHAFRI
jgi:capsular polysaccharide transport system permease protein